jgi:predicted heme/steroid binding protein
VRVLGSVLWLVLIGLVVAVAPAMATPQFASETGKDCGYCHVTPGGPLTAEGQAFADNGFVLPAATATTVAPTATTGPATTDTGGSTATSGGPATTATPPTTDQAVGRPPTAAGPILVLPAWLRTLLLWAHLVAVVAWLGAIIFVHLVQTPKVAGQGIPRGYLKLAWPSIAVLGVSGVLLTLGDITGLGMLTEGRWGRILLTKIGIYLLLAGIALFATLVMSPRLRRMNDRQQGCRHGQEQSKAEGRVTFGYAGKVYDVTGSRLWREGRHAKRHEAWLDLTDSLGGAPHGPEVFERFPVIRGGGDVTVPVMMRVFVALAYFNLFLVLAALFVVAAW